MQMICFVRYFIQIVWANVLRLPVEVTDKLVVE